MWRESFHEIFKIHGGKTGERGSWDIEGDLLWQCGCVPKSPSHPELGEQTIPAPSRTRKYPSPAYGRGESSRRTPRSIQRHPVSGPGMLSRTLKVTSMESLSGLEQA